MDKHGDPFRTTAVEVDVKPEVTSRVARPATKAQPMQRNTDKQNATGGKKTGTKRKSKADKVNQHKKISLRYFRVFFNITSIDRKR